MNGGFLREFFVESLPEHIKQKVQAALERNNTRLALPAPVDTSDNTKDLQTSTIKEKSCIVDPNAKRKNELAFWRYETIRPLLDINPYVRDKGDAINKILQIEHKTPDGKLVKLSLATIYKWLRSYQTEGFEGLVPKTRTDLGKPRTLLSRKWDRVVSLEPEMKGEITRKMTVYVRSLWAGGSRGWRMTGELASSKLVKFCQEAGCNLSQEELERICRVSRQFVETERKYAVIALKDKDAKGYFDTHTPRIMRDRSNLKPMSVVVGDVHPVDIAMIRGDGTIAYPRAISWLDLATNRVWMNFLLLPQGTGVRQEHIACSFAEMCETWGLPSKLYLDNGSEYIVGRK